MALQNGEMNVNVSQASLAGQHTKMRHIAVKGSLSHQNEQIETHNVETEGSIRPSECTMARNWKGVKACEGSGVRNCVIPHKQHVFIIRVPAGAARDSVWRRAKIATLWPSLIACKMHVSSSSEPHMHRLIYPHTRAHSSLRRARYLLRQPFIVKRALQLCVSAVKKKQAVQMATRESTR